MANLESISDTFTTKSKRNVLLEIYAAKQNLNDLQHAMQSVKRSMAWDEARFNLEYDLDRYMIVASSDFNMGAMENKGLNIFNTKYVLANKREVPYKGLPSHNNLTNKNSEPLVNIP